MSELITRAPRAVLFLVLACVTSACSSLPSGGLLPEAEQVSATDRFKRAIEFLDIGDAKRAKVELRLLLKDEPGNKRAMTLLNSVDTDPTQLLGATNVAYTVKAGETLSELADRYLNDAMLFYALARYNGIVAPREMAAGLVLKIPGKRLAAMAKPADPARASQVRLAALVQLNKGDVNGAVGQLRAAKDLDPQNVVIQQDLERALRIQKTVGAAP